MRYVRYCENMADMHWKLWLWAHDEHRPEEAAFRYGMYRQWTEACYAAEQPEHTDDDSRLFVEDWWEAQGPLVLEDRSPHEMTEYHHR